ncbi:TetR/AcrR family transcriptional regulator [Streptomyces capparidis]|jgi:AcrR family transcriptional regulator
MRADARRNHERLVAAARQAVEDQGIEVPLDQIARSAGVGAGTLYRHFPTRDDLLEAVFHDRLTTLESKARELVESVPPDEALSRWIALVLRYAATNRGLSQAVMHSSADDTSYCAGVLRSAAATVLERAQRAGAARADLDVPTLVTLVTGLGMAAQHAPGEVDRLLDLLMDGVRAR